MNSQDSTDNGGADKKAQNSSKSELRRIAKSAVESRIEFRSHMLGWMNERVKRGQTIPQKISEFLSDQATGDFGKVITDSASSFLEATSAAHSSAAKKFSNSSKANE